MRVIPSAYKGNGEKKTRDLIKQLDCKSFELAYWSIHVHEHATKEFSDIDFLLLTERGLCCFEVKGGRVEYADGKTTYTNRYGKRNTKLESPNAQAAGNKRALKQRIEFQFPEYKNAFCYAHAVVFPDQYWDFSSDSFEMKKQVIFDKASFDKGPQELKKFLSKLFTYFDKETVYKNAKPLDAKIIKKLREFLRPNFEYLPSLNHQLDDVDNHILEMTSEQLNVLNSIDGNDRIIVDGSAGSGKTILALHTAEKLVNEKINCCYLVRNRFWNDAIKHKFTKIGCDVLCLEKNFHTNKKYEAIIVDEGQDLLSEDCFNNFLSLLELPLHKSQVYWFMDSYNQSHLYEDIDIETIELLSGDFFKYKLNENCRNPIEVIKETNKLTGTNIQYSRNANSREMKYEILDSDNKEKHGNKVQKIIDELVAEGAMLEDICLVTLTNSDDSCINFLQSNTKTMVHDFCMPTHGVNKIKFYDVRSIKGQESKFVIIIDCYSTQSLDNLKNYLYTALTRATFHPSIVINASLYTDLL